MVNVNIHVLIRFDDTQNQPPPQALRSSHGERETSDW